ncbi:MAG TPA: phosphate ABC transporter substrate-binding protein PstS [Candidatus Corynebacterium avicola]|uniref:Phosphate-binding protein n=1 Tax=Candidatus Corynebacterium avicola TaxID=2838527 RepID=A0A9D1RLQ4_9CORY|nr:phosphate ABC transporter substrate-binding protein PstS [Candidatus Corynebacterium avicola]
MQTQRPQRRTAATTAAVTVAVSSLILAGCSNSEGGDGETTGEGNYELSNTEGELTGEGASSQQKAIEQFGVAYSSAVPGATLSYNATGSGSGQTQFIADQVDFAGSDSALDEEQAPQAAERCGGNDAWHLPLVVGPVAVAYNLEGVDDLNLSVETVAKIFKGDIKNWNDEAIAAENEGVDLPDQPIDVLYRSEESGTSDNFQKFLNVATDGEWEGEGKTFPTDVGSGAQGSSGVADQVAQTNGSITYVESGFATASDLGIANIDFGAGPTELSSETVNKALDSVEFSGEGNDLVVDSEALFGTEEEGAYPLALTTYEIVCSAGYDEETAGRVKDFMYTVLDSQDEEYEESGYIPLSGEFKEKLETAIGELE